MKNISSNLTPEYIVEIILRRRWYLIIPFCLTMLAGIFYAVSAPKIYEASTLILIEPQRVSENYVQSIVAVDPDTRITTLSEQVNSRTNLERIIHDFNLFPGVENEKMFMEDKINAMRGRISVDVTHAGGRRGAINSFSISYRGKDPDKTMKIANTLADYLIGDNLKKRESSAIGTSEFLNEELNTMRGRLVEVEARLEAHRKQYMGQLPEQLDTNLSILERLQEQLSDRRQSLREEKNRLAVVEQLIASPPTFTQVEGQAAPAVGESSDLDVLKEQLAVLTTKYTQRHPDVVKIKKMIADLERERASESETTNDPTSSQVSGSQSQPGLRDENYRQREEIRLAINSLETEISELQNQIAIYENRVEATPKREQELASLQRDYENIQTTYNSLLERKLEADIAVNMEKKQKGEQFQILDSASLPQRPIKPDMRKLLLIFLAAGFGIGGGIIFLLEYLNTSFRRTEDVEYLGVSILATIPLMASRKNRVLQISNQLLSVVSILISVTLFAGFSLLCLKGQDETLNLIGKFETIFTNKPVLIDKPTSSKIIPKITVSISNDLDKTEEIPSTAKEGDSSKIIKSANKESDRDALSNVSYESEISTPVLEQSLGQIPLTETQETLIDKTPSLSPSEVQSMLNSALSKWGKIVFIREGEDISALVERVYGVYHPGLLDAVLEENQEIKNKSISAGQAVNLPKSYKLLSTTN